MPHNYPSSNGDPTELRRRAEERARTEPPILSPGEDPHRLLHELQVHQIQLEMQNEEMREARIQLENLVNKYTDLYDFAPVGYFSIDPEARIQEVNLTGAAMLELDRSHLISCRFTNFVTSPTLPTFGSFLHEICDSDDKKICEVELRSEQGTTLWVDLQGTRVLNPDDGPALCRIAVSDISAMKRAAEAQRRTEALESLNKALEAEVARRKITEQSLRESEQLQSDLLKESDSMQKQLRMLSHQVLDAQEVERKSISRDLHDEIAQTLAAINVHLASLAGDPAAATDQMQKKIAETQSLVAQSVESVHRFAMGLRPTMLDDIGLASALRAYTQDFTKETNIPVQLDLPKELTSLGDGPATALYRIARAAMSNIFRHAKATEVGITLRQTRGTLTLKVTDNGKSFDVKSAQSAKNTKRIGLIGMRERAEMIGAEFRITSTPSKGTTVSVRLPLAKDHATPLHSKPKEST